MTLYAKTPSDKFEQTQKKTKAAGARYTIFDSEINLRQELHKLLIEERGHPVFFRKVTEVVGPNYDPAYKESRVSGDPYVIGTKNMYQDYIIYTYRRSAVDVEAQARERRTEIGYMGQGKFVYYFEPRFMNPNTGVEGFLTPTKADYILEADLDEDGNFVRAFQINRILNIQFVQEMRSRDGRVEYYVVHCAERAVGA